MRAWWTNSSPNTSSALAISWAAPSGMMAGPAAPDQRRPALDVGEIVCAPATAVGDPPGRVADGPEAVDARTALAGALGGQERHDLRGRGHTADARSAGSRRSRSRTVRPRSLITTGSRGMSQTSPIIRPRPEVATEHDRRDPVRAGTRLRRPPRRPSSPSSISRTPGAGRAPVTVTRAVPRVPPRPADRYQRVASACDEGRVREALHVLDERRAPPTPRSETRGGVVTGRASPVLMQLTAADASPAT